MVNLQSLLALTIHSIKWTPYVFFSLDRNTSTKTSITLLLRRNSGQTSTTKNTNSELRTVFYSSESDILFRITLEREMIPMTMILSLSILNFEAVLKHNLLYVYTFLYWWGRVSQIMLILIGSFSLLSLNAVDAEVWFQSTQIGSLSRVLVKTQSHTNTHTYTKQSSIEFEAQRTPIHNNNKTEFVLIYIYAIKVSFLFNLRVCFVCTLDYHITFAIVLEYSV